jgi:hypothetical protein
VLQQTVWKTARPESPPQWKTAAPKFRKGPGDLGSVISFALRSHTKWCSSYKYHRVPCAEDSYRQANCGHSHALYILDQRGSMQPSACSFRSIHVRGEISEWSGISGWLRDPGQMRRRHPVQSFFFLSVTHIPSFSALVRWLPDVTHADFRSQGVRDAW